MITMSIQVLIFLPVLFFLSELIVCYAILKGTFEVHCIAQPTGAV